MVKAIIALASVILLGAISFVLIVQYERRVKNLERQVNVEFVEVCNRIDVLIEEIRKMNLTVMRRGGLK